MPSWLIAPCTTADGLPDVQLNFPVDPTGAIHSVTYAPPRLARYGSIRRQSTGLVPMGNRNILVAGRFLAVVATPDGFGGCDGWSREAGSGAAG
jgi:hypothetical protein